MNWSFFLSILRLWVLPFFLKCDARIVSVVRTVFLDSVYSLAGYIASYSNYLWSKNNKHIFDCTVCTQPIIVGTLCNRRYIVMSLFFLTPEHGVFQSQKEDRHSFHLRPVLFGPSGLIPSVGLEDNPQRQRYVLKSNSQRSYYCCGHNMQSKVYCHASFLLDPGTLNVSVPERR